MNKHNNAFIDDMIAYGYQPKPRFQWWHYALSAVVMVAVFYGFILIMNVLKWWFEILFLTV